MYQANVPQPKDESYNSTMVLYYICNWNLACWTITCSCFFLRKMDITHLNAIYLHKMHFHACLSYVVVDKAYAILDTLYGKSWTKAFKNWKNKAIVNIYSILCLCLLYYVIHLKQKSLIYYNIYRKPFFTLGRTRQLHTRFFWIFCCPAILSWLFFRWYFVKL